uniref:Uncharacterized protein n=1 Tax=Glycine max TaxID=3847 RepID=A0A0R0F112_SOYBN
MGPRSILFLQSHYKGHCRSIDETFGYGYSLPSTWCMLRKSLHNLLYPSPPMRTIDQVTITCIYNNHVQFPTFFRRLCSISIKLVVCFNFNPFLSIFFLIIYLNFEIHSWCSRFLFLFHCIL